MNNVKKLLAVLIVVTMLVTAMIPAMAADSFVYEDEAEVLADLGLMVGDGTDMNLDGELTREMGVVLLVRLLGAEEDALDMTDAEIAAALEDYSDKDEISFWAEAYVAYATEEGYLKGRDDGSLDPKANLLGKDYATMILRAMGYEVDAAMWAVAADELADVGGLSDDEAELFNDKALIRDDAAGITYAALLGEVEDGGTLIAALVAAGAVDEELAIAAGLIPAIADVADVAMSNLREVVVTFTAPVDATQAAKVANYTVGAKAPKAAAVAADGKSVVLTLDAAAYTTALANYTNYTVVIKAAVGIPADVTKTVKAVDVTVPNIVSAASVGPKAIKVTFSEPLASVTNAVAVASAFKLDNGTIALRPLAADANGIVIADGAKSIILETYIDLAEGKHTLAFDGTLLKDAAGYAVQPVSRDFNFAKDLSALTYTVGATNETSVKITFNKILTDNSFSNVRVSHSYNSSTYAAVVSTTDKLTYTFDWSTTGKPLPPGQTTIYVSYVDAAGTKITDQYGITMGAFSFPVTTTPDFVKPTATVAFVDPTHITVTFSENVDETTAITNYATNYVLKDSAGTQILFAGTPTFTTNYTVVSLVTATQMNGGSYTLEIKNVKDRALAGNVIDTVVLPFTCTDKVAPGYASTPFTKLSDTVIKVSFNEVMDAATITNKLAYKLNGLALASGDTITTSGDGKSAIITFASAPANGAVLSVTSPLMKDLAGNWIDNAADAIKSYTFVNLVPLTAKEVAITGKNSIKVTIADIVTGMSLSDFAVSIGGDSYTVTGFTSVVYDATNTYITLTVDRDFAVSAVAVNTDYTTITVATTASATTNKTIKNAYGNYLSFSVNSVVDKYTPAIKEVSRILDANGKITAIKVEFTENMYVASITDTDFTVTGTTVLSVNCSDVTLLNGQAVGKVFVLDVTDIAGADAIGTAINPTVTIAGSVEDAARNALANVSKASTVTILPQPI